MGMGDRGTGGAGAPDQWPTDGSVTRINPWVVVGAAALVLAVAVGALVFVLSGRDDDRAGDADPETLVSVTQPTAPTPTPAPTPPPSPPSLPPPVTTAPIPETTTAPSVLGGGSTNSGPYMSDAEAIAALSAIVAEDDGRVGAMVDVWVPQVSSKRPGLDVEDDDRGAYTAADVLADHLGYEDRYRAEGIDVRLLRSDDFNFKVDGFFVTVIDLQFPSGEAANEWCNARGIGVDDCFAKRLSRSGEWQGSVVSRK